MRILLLTKYFPPEIGTAAHLFFELAESLSQRGHKVTVVTGFPWYNLSRVEKKYQKKLFLTETMNGFRVLRLAMPRLPQGPWRYKTGHVLEPPLLLLGGLLAGPQDIVVAYSPPLLVGLASSLVGKWKGIPSVVNVQDLHPQCYVDQGLIKNSSLIKVLEAMEAYVYAHNQAIVVHSRGNRTHVLTRGGQRALVIPNWVDTDLITPGEKANQFSRVHGLEDKFVVSFAGTIGVSQGILSVVDAAPYLRPYPEILLLIVGGGVDETLVRQRAAELQLENLKLLPMQPREIYPQILEASDVCLVTLNKEVKTPVIPSKILNIMAAGRPVLASISLNGDAPKLIAEAQCGLCVAPEAPEILAEAIVKLYQDKELRRILGQNGRRFAEKHFSRAACMAQYEALFQAFRQGRPVRPDQASQ